MATIKTFRVTQIAREFDIDAKRVRANLRRAYRANAKNVPHVVDDEGNRVAHTHNASWTFATRDEARVARIIMTDAQFARYNAKRARAKTSSDEIA